VKRLLASLLALALAGCASVAPYQRGYLARPGMSFEESAAMAKTMEKVFVAKEAASGSASVGGSGCGCN
jgi:tripartite-type tricarboxylate transporter receptor subunit TctC